LQHSRRIGKARRNPTTLAQLRGHERFPIAKSDNLTIGNAMDGVKVLIGNLSATDYGNTKHRDQNTEGNKLNRDW